MLCFEVDTDLEDYFIGNNDAIIAVRFSNSEGKTVILGDINGDGKTNSVDMNLMKRLITGTLLPTPEQAVSADINCDGKTNAIDASLMKSIILDIYKPA